jgi:hypothetical protein
MSKAIRDQTVTQIPIITVAKSYPNFALARSELPSTFAAAC